MYQRILIATDGTTLSRRAEAAGIELAEAIGAEIVVLSVIPKASRVLLDPIVVAEHIELGDVERLWSERAERTVARVKDAAGRKQLGAKTVTVVSDSAADAILAVAKKHRCDLIVMASHGRKGLGRVLLGSETQHVLVNSHLPVLVVR